MDASLTAFLNEHITRSIGDRVKSFEPSTSAYTEAEKHFFDMNFMCEYHMRHNEFLKRAWSKELWIKVLSYLRDYLRQWIPDIELYLSLDYVRHFANSGSTQRFDLGDVILYTNTNMILKTKINLTDRNTSSANVSLIDKDGVAPISVHYNLEGIKSYNSTGIDQYRIRHEIVPNIVFRTDPRIFLDYLTSSGDMNSIANALLTPKEIRREVTSLRLLNQMSTDQIELLTRQNNHLKDELRKGAFSQIGRMIQRTAIHILRSLHILESYTLVHNPLLKEELYLLNSVLLFAGIGRGAFAGHLNKYFAPIAILWAGHASMQALYNNIFMYK